LLDIFTEGGADFTATYGDLTVEPTASKYIASRIAKPRHWVVKMKANYAGPTIFQAKCARRAFTRQWRRDGNMGKPSHGATRLAFERDCLHPVGKDQNRESEMADSLLYIQTNGFCRLYFCWISWLVPSSSPVTVHQRAGFENCDPRIKSGAWRADLELLILDTRDHITADYIDKWG